MKMMIIRRKSRKKQQKTKMQILRGGVTPPPSQFESYSSSASSKVSDTLGCASYATFLFLPHFDVICDLLLNRRTATWNLFVK